MKLLIRFFLVAAVSASILYSMKGQENATINSHLDSLQKAVTKLPNDTNKVMLLNQLSFEYNTVSPYDGIRYGVEALMLAQQFDWKPGIARSNSSLGANYFSLSDYPNAYEYWLKSLRINEEVGNKTGVANHLHNIGMVFYSQQNYAKALDYYNRALVVSKEIGNDKFATNSYAAMGNVYAKLKNYQLSLENHFKALALDKQSGKEKAISADMINIGSVYVEQGDFERALQMLTEALQIKKKINDKNGTAKAFNLIGKTYFNKSEKTGNASDLTTAQHYLDSSVSIATQIGYLDNLQNSYEFLAKAQEQTGNYKSALHSYKEYYAIKDSIFSGSRQTEIFNLEKKADLEEKKRKQEQEQARMETRKYTQIAGISLFIIILLGFVMMLSKVKIKPTVLDLLSTLSLIILFEFVQLLLHSSIEEIAHHDLLITFLFVLAIAAVIIPLHHVAEHWMKKRLTHTSNQDFHRHHKETM